MTQETKVCGIVMPISSIDDCGESHWAEVLNIFSDAISSAGFEPNLVSNADDVGIIHKRIVQNLYDNPIVVCDVSGKNPNVMFELGMRLAFDKPTIIVKDDRTSYSFDTSAIEHLEYPRDLRFSSIVEFKELLVKKIKATVKANLEDPDHTTFLKHYGEFKVAQLEQTEVSGQEFIIEELKSLRSDIRRLEYSRHNSEYESMLSNIGNSRNLNICLRRYSEEQIEIMIDVAKSLDYVSGFRTRRLGPDHKHLILELDSPKYRKKAREKVIDAANSYEPALTARLHTDGIDSREVNKLRKKDAIDSAFS